MKRTNLRPPKTPENENLNPDRSLQDMSLPELRRLANQHNLLKPGIRSRTDLIDILSKNVPVENDADENGNNENIVVEKNLLRQNKRTFSSPEMITNYDSFNDDDGFDDWEQDFVDDDTGDAEKIDPTYRLDFKPLVSRYMEFTSINIDTKDFDKASVGMKFDLLRAEWIGMTRYNPFYLITGDMAASGVNEYSLNPTENYVEPKSTLVIYEGQEKNYTQLATHLGLLDLKEPLLKGHIIEILWWLIFGDFEFNFGTIVSRIRDAAQMKHADLTELLHANGYTGPDDRPASILAYGTGKVVPGTTTTEYKEYRDLIMNKDSFAVFMTADLVLNLLKIEEGDKVVADMYGPYRLLALTMDNANEPRPDIQVCLQLTPDKSLEISDKYGFEMHPDIVTETSDSYLGIFAMAHSYYNDGVFGRKQAPAGKRLSQNELKLLTNQELIERFNLDFAKLYYKGLAKYNFRETLINEAMDVIQKKQRSFWRMVNESCEQKKGVSYQYGIANDHICFDSSLLDKEAQAASKYPAFSTGLTENEVLTFGEVIGPILTFKQVISLADYIMDINRITPKNYKECLDEGYERDLIQIAKEYESQLKVQEEIREEYNTLDQENKVIVINLLLWAIHAGTSGVNENYVFYEDISRVFSGENFEGVRSLLEKTIHTKIHINKGLVFVTNDIMVFSKTTRAEDLINYGDGYLQIFNYPPDEIENMLESWRANL